MSKTVRILLILAFSLAGCKDKAVPVVQQLPTLRVTVTELTVAPDTSVEFILSGQPNHSIMLLQGTERGNASYHGVEVEVGDMAKEVTKGVLGEDGTFSYSYQVVGMSGETYYFQFITGTNLEDPTTLSVSDLVAITIR